MKTNLKNPNISSIADDLFSYMKDVILLFLFFFFFLRFLFRFDE